MKCVIMRSDVDEILKEHGLKGMFLYSDSAKTANMYYMTGLLAIDPFIYLKKIDEDPMMIINQLEFARAQKEARVRDIRCTVDYDFMRIVKSAPDSRTGIMKFVAKVAKKELGVKTPVYVPPNLPVAVADCLRQEGLKIKPTFNVIEKARETKEPDEIEAIQSVQKTVEKAANRVIGFIAKTDIGPDRRLVYREGGKKQVLTVGKLRSIFDYAFVDDGCVAEEETTIGVGPLGALGHYAGEPEDELKANEPVLLDIFPRSAKNRYVTDMARTIVKGRATRVAKRMFETVFQVRNAVLDATTAGTPGMQLQLLCYDMFEKAGYNTMRGGKQIAKGYRHSVGHGIGLEVHEGPSMGELSNDPLKEHNVVTIEPSLCDPKIGAVGIEDPVEITNKGFRNLSKMKICFEV